MCEIAVLSLLLLSLAVVESLAVCLKTVRTRHAPIINSAHGFVALVAWQLDLVVINDILFHDCVAALATLQLRLAECVLVEVTLWNVAVVAWNVRGYLSGAHGQVVQGVRLPH